MDYHVRLKKPVDDLLKKVAARNERSVAYLIRQLVDYGVASHPLFVEKPKRPSVNRQ